MHTQHTPEHCPSVTGVWLPAAKVRTVEQGNEVVLDYNRTYIIIALLQNLQFGQEVNTHESTLVYINDSLTDGTNRSERNLPGRIPNLCINFAHRRWSTTPHSLSVGCTLTAFQRVFLAWTREEGFAADNLTSSASVREQRQH